jgi:hypothetical protein
MPQQFVEQQQQQLQMSHLSGYGMNAAAAIIPRISPSVAPAAAAAASVITPTTPTAIPNNMIINNTNNSGASSNSSTPNATNGSRVGEVILICKFGANN